MQLYQLKFPNGKSYIGITSKTAQERFKAHCSKSQKKNACQVAINKYGKENVKLKVLATVENWELLCLAEIEAIEKFNTFAPNGNGYNLTMGGEGSLVVSVYGQDRLVRDKGIRAAYLANNRECLLSKRKKYRDKNSTKIVEYRINNIEKTVKYSKQWYQINRDIVIEKQKIYREKNKEIIRNKANMHYQKNKSLITKNRREKRIKIKNDFNTLNHDIFYNLLTGDL